MAKFLVACLCGSALWLTALGAQGATQDCQGAPSSTRLFVHVDGARSSKGNAVVNIYRSNRRSFLRDELLIAHAPADPGGTTVCLFLPAPGEYAAVAYHDANANGELDLNFLGLPREGFGFSNNVRPIFSAPSLRQVLFTTVSGDNSIHIRVRYLY